MQKDNEVIDTCLIAACIKAVGSLMPDSIEEVNRQARDLYKLVTAEPWEKGKKA